VCATKDTQVLTVADIALADARSLLAQYGLELLVQDDGEAITGSFWGGPEAGIIRNTVHVRSDTPVHSLLHEACHIICMTADRRGQLDRDAGGDDLEEAAVCYLQVVLADQLAGVGSPRLMRDMDAWGYSFRLGSTRRWWHEDAEDARAWLISKGLLTDSGEPLFVLRGGV
jgi:hypothetical protein